MDRLGLRRHRLIWAAVLPIALWALFRLFGLEWGFPLVPLIAYTPYVAPLALLVTGVAVALRNWPAAAVAAVATGLLMAAVLPRAFGGGSPIPAGEAELRVLAANVHDGAADPVALVRLARELDVDVLSVEELTPSYANRLVSAGVGRQFRFLLDSIPVLASGTGLYSRFRMRPVPPPGNELFAAHAEVELPGRRRVRVAAVHDFPPKRGGVDVWSGDLQKLPAADPDGSPWILLGDFNATLDQAEFRDLVATGYRDAGDATGNGLDPTFSAGEVLPPPITIDHVLADERITIAEYSTEDLPGSDHRAVFARLGVP